MILPSCRILSWKWIGWLEDGTDTLIGVMMVLKKMNTRCQDPLSDGVQCPGTCGTQQSTSTHLAMVYEKPSQ